MDPYLKDIQAALIAGNATEHTYRPALKQFLENLSPGITATNEPKRVACGAPDFIVTRGQAPLGYVEAKDVNVDLTRTEGTPQLKRYLESLGNVVLTDYLEFRWYVGGAHRLTARAATVAPGGKLRISTSGLQAVKDLLSAFLTAGAPTVGSPKELAGRMAALARLISEVIANAFTQEDTSGSLHQQMAGFRKVLLHELSADQFADMYAQSIAYGLFAARVNAPNAQGFTREQAAYDLPKTNPFLRKMFTYLAGPDLDPRIEWAVDDLAELLRLTDIAAILRDFGKRTRQEDPVLHFYETFLAAYNPEMRETRGVYYTPEPVVAYIVRSVEHILKQTFKLSAGLADSGMIKVPNPDPKAKAKTIEAHRLQILDPATGTGTFLHGVIDQIHATVTTAGQKGAWSGYVATHLLPRLFGFELLMAPYAVAHMKLGIQLRELGYDFASDERLRIYLTNTLEQAHDAAGLPLFAQWLATEANAASEIKRDAPVMVVLGNPPYSGHSMNAGKWIIDLLKGKESGRYNPEGDYFSVDGEPLGETQVKWLHDDYVKFFKFAQWRIERTGYGVLAFISNHGYLDNPTFRGMRRSLMNTFDDIFILNLHGNTKKKEVAPDGSGDENVFDIQQGVAIGLFVKRTKGGKRQTAIRYADLWGPRELLEDGIDGPMIVGGKYHRLWTSDVSTTEWEQLAPVAPFYAFIPQEADIRDEYQAFWSLKEVLPVNTVGIVTARDNLTIKMNTSDVLATVKDFSSLSADEAREKYDLGDDARDWQVSLAQKDLREEPIQPDKVIPLLYRPFDKRFTYYTGKSRGFIGQPQKRVMQHMLGGHNLGLSTARKIDVHGGWEHVFCSSMAIQHHTVSLKEVNYLFPLYLVPEGLFQGADGTLDRAANLAPAFIEALTSAVSMAWVALGQGDRIQTIGPEDAFHYIYAILYCPGYRQRYSEFLRADFPRIPLTTNASLFEQLCHLGSLLVSLHTMAKPLPLVSKYPVPGSDVIEVVRYAGPGQGTGAGRVVINATQYFEGVSPQLWEFRIGGYQVAEKWLKDRKGKQLSYDDLTYYQQVLAALDGTRNLMASIDAAVEQAGGWPLGGVPLKS